MEEPGRTPGQANKTAQKTAKSGGDFTKNRGYLYILKKSLNKLQDKSKCLIKKQQLHKIRKSASLNDQISLWSTALVVAISLFNGISGPLLSHTDHAALTSAH